MNSEKNHPTPTTKPQTLTSNQAKSQAIEDEKAALVKSGQLPAYMQRRAMSVDDEKKRKQQN
jgi:hypothetical protein